MKIAVIGLWHLGCVTAACLAKAGHTVIGFDPDKDNITNLRLNKPPIYEPGLEDLITETAGTGNLAFTDMPQSLNDAEIVWITFDTPVDDNDIADTNYVIHQIKTIIPHLGENTLILISSQLPVGTSNYLQRYCDAQYPTRRISIGYIPENLRLGKAIEVFSQPDRFVVGLTYEEDNNKVEQALSPITSNIIWMSAASAEMTKHALNAFLATSIVFINELASICEKVGANAQEVEQGLKSEARIGHKAYLKAGGAIAGGTLLRDVNYLNQFSEIHNILTPLMSAILESNQYHKDWLKRKVISVLSNLTNKKIAILGLTYKPHTNTLRRSTAIEIARWLNAEGACVTAYDPAIDSLPTDLSNTIQLKDNISDALNAADAIIVATEWPEFRNSDLNHQILKMKQPLIFDPSSFLQATFAYNDAISYYTIGRAA